MRQIVDSMDNSVSVDKLTAFNLLAYERTGVITGEVITRTRNFELEDEKGRRIPFEICGKEFIDPGLIDRQIVHYGNYEPFMKYEIVFQDTIPAMGYRTYFLKESQEENRSVAGGTSTDVIENRYYKIEVSKNGTLCITDKERGNTYSEVLLLEDGSDDGDKYDYSPLEEDFVVTGKDVDAAVKIHCLDHMTKAAIRYSMPVPKNLRSRKTRRCVGVLGKEKLYRRPGRPSGIKMETPDSQMQGLQRFEFALTTWIPRAAQQAKEYTTPVITYN